MNVCALESIVDSRMAVSLNQGWMLEINNHIESQKLEEFPII